MPLIIALSFFINEVLLVMNTHNTYTVSTLVFNEKRKRIIEQVKKFNMSYT